MYITVILPLALQQEYTYSVLEEFRSDIQIGIRVEVTLKNKGYAAIVAEIHSEIDEGIRPKSIIGILDYQPVITQKQLRFWHWISNYYLCSLGEVMHAALPSGLKLESETKIVISTDFDGDFSQLSDEEYLVAEALSIREELTIEEVRSILNKKSIYPTIRSLLDYRVIDIYEVLVHKYKPKKIRAVRLHKDYRSERTLGDFIDQKIKSEKQKNAIYAYITLDQAKYNLIPVSDIYEYSNTNSSVIKALEKKGIFVVETIEASRLTIYDSEVTEVPQLSQEQIKALHQINHYFEIKKPVLIHGITGSGKTRMYIEIIQEMIRTGKQCLYLLPEIALTTQIVERLESYFGNDILIYHSRLSNNQRVETWKEVLKEKKIILGARSSLFLPFQNLGLIIVDEEHDSSFKQQNPSPRYNARDLSIVLAKQHNAFILLGSATPSIESYTNAKTGKYGLVELHNRYGDSVLPKIELVNLKREKQVGRLRNTIVSRKLEEEIKHTLDNNKQVIIFQNRRGFSPVVQCNDCGWRAECKNCDVTLTLHQYFHEMRCHYCGYRTKKAEHCPECSSKNLYEIGQGTERIEDDLKSKFPEARIARMDYDTTKTKSAFEELVYDFSRGRKDILVGTQMVTKGFDFDNLGLVGVINADSLTKFPDFRAGERAFQQLTQVAGRAGRRGEQGLVIIQAFTPDHPSIQETLHHDYIGFYKREMKERKEFSFPPYVRVIRIELKHKRHDVLAHGSQYFADQLYKKLGFRVKGPFIPSVSRVKNNYIQFINLKLELKTEVISTAKELVLKTKENLRHIDVIKGIRVNIDVDPY
jgi:primosomal protein N' (replication factor Y)